MTWTRRGQFILVALYDPLVEPALLLLDRVVEILVQLIERVGPRAELFRDGLAAALDLRDPGIERANIVRCVFATVGSLVLGVSPEQVRSAEFVEFRERTRRLRQQVVLVTFVAERIELTVDRGKFGLENTQRLFGFLDTSVQQRFFGSVFRIHGNHLVQGNATALQPGPLSGLRPAKRFRSPRRCTST